MKTRIVLFVVLMCAVSFACFGQASALREYVGMISQAFHPDVVAHMEGLKDKYEKRGNTELVRTIDFYLRGDSGTGFVYVAPDGKNYIITNFHVISQAQIDGLSVTFETQDGEKTRYSGLHIAAADEDLDVAVLVFAEGQAPFKQGLAFLNRPAQDLDDVYSAGFPRLGTSMIWQLGRGTVSNASVRLPDPDDETKTIGPYIQHTAQVDPGNSGGPLLIQAQGVPVGFAVAGINTLSARFRQGANYSIPMNRVQAFLETALKPKGGTDLEGLEARIGSFLEGLSAAKAVYPHIAKYLSNACTAENFEYAESELDAKAPAVVWNNYVDTFNGSPVTGMSYAVGWLIENSLRSRSGSISITKESVTAVDDDNYTVVFIVNNTPISSEWTNEYGIWRIKTFGDFAAGDKSMLGKKQNTKAESDKLVTEPSLRISANFINIFDPGPGPAFGAEFKVSFNKFTAFGFQGFFGGKDYTQIEAVGGLYIPIRVAGKVAFIPFADAGLGVRIVPEEKTIKYDFWGDPYEESSSGENNFQFGLSVKGGLMFTTAAVPGLYLQAAYQYSFEAKSPVGVGSPIPARGMLIVGLGYSL